MLPGYEEHLAERIIPESVIYDGDQVIADYGAYRRSEGKLLGSQCARCYLYASCEGPWREYPELFGWDEFVPWKHRTR